MFLTQSGLSSFSIRVSEKKKILFLISFSVRKKSVKKAVHDLDTNPHQNQMGPKHCP